MRGPPLVAVGLQQRHDLVRLQRQVRDRQLQRIDPLAADDQVAVVAGDDRHVIPRDGLAASPQGLDPERAQQDALRLPCRAHHGRHGDGDARDAPPPVHRIAGERDQRAAHADEHERGDDHQGASPRRPGRTRRRSAPPRAGAATGRRRRSARTRRRSARTSRRPAASRSPCRSPGSPRPPRRRSRPTRETAARSFPCRRRRPRPSWQFPRPLGSAVRAWRSRGSPVMSRLIWVAAAFALAAAAPTAARAAVTPDYFTLPAEIDRHRRRPRRRAGRNAVVLRRAGGRRRPGADRPPRRVAGGAGDVQRHHVGPDRRQPWTWAAASRSSVTSPGRPRTACLYFTRSDDVVGPAQGRRRRPVDDRRTCNTAPWGIAAAPERRGVVQRERRRQLGELVRQPDRLRHARDGRHGDHEPRVPGRSHAVDPLRYDAQPEGYGGRA